MKLRPFRLTAIGLALGLLATPAVQAARDGRFSPHPVNRNDSRAPRGPVRPGARTEPRYDGSAANRRAARYDRNTREVIGVVTSTSSMFDRDIKVRLDNGQTRTIDVPRDIPIRRGGQTISVHRISRDEVVRIQIERYATSGDLRARRIDVLGRGGQGIVIDRGGGVFGSTRVRGRVSNIDTRLEQMGLDADGRRLIVHADRARISDGGRTRTLRNLKNGDRVTVEGRRDGDRLYATRITVD